jgi:hypothetical protein
MAATLDVILGRLFHQARLFMAKIFVAPPRWSPDIISLFVRDFRMIARNWSCIDPLEAMHGHTRKR